MFAVDDIDDVVARLRSDGAELIGEIAQDKEIYISESHASYFPLNLVAILAELRAALGVLAPAGVGTVTGWD